jgi:zinc protease
MSARAYALLLSLALAACGGSTPAQSTTPTSEATPADTTAQPGAATPAPKEPPPASATARDIAFPPVTHLTLDNGLVIDVVTQKQLPIVSVQLVVMSGSSSDPKGLPGVATFVADMLKEGTKKKSAQAFAEAVEYLGAHLNVGAGQETTRISVSAMSEHFDAALALAAEATLEPRFDPKEIAKLKKRTLDELKLKKDKPHWLARREMQKALYGEHPYAISDTNEAAVNKLNQQHLSSFHTQNFAPNNAFLVVVGDVTPDVVKASAEKAFGKWKKRDVKKPAYAPPPALSARQIIVVDRPASVQSQIAIANLALKRNGTDFVPLLVANQVLGGSAASRLFMDLREKRSLTYGAYSRVDESVDLGAFRASAAVRTPVTGEAVGAFLEHFDRIIKEPAPEPELSAAHRYLADSFPLQIETADRVADLLADLRVYGLPADYWDSFRTMIRKVSANDALAAARSYIHPESLVIVVVGKAADIVPALEKYGPVRVVDADGKQLRSATPTAEADGQKPTPANEKAAKAKPAAEKPAVEKAAAPKPVPEKAETKPAPTPAPATP